MKKEFGYDNNDFDLMRTAAMGATATIAHDFFITPGDSKRLDHLMLLVVKQRLQLQPNLSAIKCARDIIKAEGIRALYRSYPVTVFMNIPFATTVVCVNENMKTWLKPWDR